MPPPPPPLLLPLVSTDPVTQMNTYLSYVTILADINSKDETKLKAAQELSENFEAIITSPQYLVFLEHSINIFLKILQDGESHFIAEYNIQQVRKLILEMVHRLPTNDSLRPYVKQILTLMLKLLEIENEDNVLVCLPIIIKLHRQYRPTFNAEIPHFLAFVKSIYRDLPNHMSKIFEPRQAMRVKEVPKINVIESLLAETYTVTVIQSEKKGPDGTVISYNLIPKAVLSLKVLQKLPIVVLLMYKLYKQNVHQEVADFIPLIMSTITLQPSPQHRSNPKFNKEVFVDFMGAQIKTLSFLVPLIRIYQEQVAQHSTLMVKGMLGLLALCPMEVAHLRKELLLAATHILATDLRIKFVPYMDRLFDENVLLGRGWTTNESLRPLAYSTLGDLVHHVRQHLPLVDLARAVHLFSKNVHDESLPTTIQTMSCKLLLNLVDCIRQRSEGEDGTGRELLMRMLEVFVLKFKTIVKLQLPVLITKYKPHTAHNDAGIIMPPNLQTITSDSIRFEDLKPSNILHVEQFDNMFSSKFGFPMSHSINYSVSDCRILVKVLVFGVKTITSGCVSCKGKNEAETSNKQFLPHETLVFIRLVKWALQALDIYTMSLNPLPGTGLPQPCPNVQASIQGKEEKEVLEHFSGVFSIMNPETFQEIFTTTIDYMVERIYQNFALQIVGDSFLANPTMSPIFAQILVEYLLERMEEMGNNLDRSHLYLELFNAVFKSVSLFPQENEHMLRPHLHVVVNRSMELAMTAKEPYNYFLLLRALFQSIAGGSHDLLYKEFLPLLPNLLAGLNGLQSGLHKQCMRDLFVELCLTVPVRLSSLLPYLPMLMDPLVSALNGSNTLISQGLRTLELCVDNLQPDFLYEHIQPVHADLMQALWRTLRHPSDQVAHVAFRVLGKFGGGNRKMMIEPQRLEYDDKLTMGPTLVVRFVDHSPPIHLPIERAIDYAVSVLKVSSTDTFYRQQCWEVVRCYLIASANLEDDRISLTKMFTHPSFSDPSVRIVPIQGIPYKLSDVLARTTHVTALTGMFVAAAVKELSSEVLPTLMFFVSHYTMIAIIQQAGAFAMNNRQQELTGMDPLVLIDALAAIMGHEEKNLREPGIQALKLIKRTAVCILGSKQRASRLPYLEYLAERMCSLCYEQAWYAKLGGCIAIKFLMENFEMRWIFEHLFPFLKALLFVMMDLTGEVSGGATHMAKANLEKMITTCAEPLTPDSTNEELILVQKKSLFEVTRELVRQVTSPNTLVREEAMHLLRVLAVVKKVTVTAVMEPHKEVLQDMVPPKKHRLHHQPANAQIGIMDGNTFCSTLEPRLFTVDLNIQEHKVFFHELMSLCEADDAVLAKYPCYKNINNMVPIRKSALRSLSACYNVVSYQEKVFVVLYKVLEKNNAELQQAAFECMKKFITSFTMDMEKVVVHNIMRPLLLTLGDYRNLSLVSVHRLSYMTQLFPASFNEKLCEQLLHHLKKLLELTVQNHKGMSRNVENDQKIATIIEIFHQIPAAGPKYIETLCRLLMQTEKQLLIEVSSMFRVPLMKFFLRFPTETIKFFLSDSTVVDPQSTRYLEFMMKHADGKPMCAALQANPERLKTLVLSKTNHPTASAVDKAEMQYQAIRIVSILIKYDDQWLSSEHDLIAAYKQIWCTESYQELHKKVDSVDYVHWKEPKLLVKILLHYFCHHPTKIDLLFQLLRALCDRFLPDFQFLRDFLEMTVAQNYTVEWKRAAFFQLVEHFPSASMSQQLKSKVLQLVLIPCFAVSFDRGEGDKLVGTPTLEADNTDNVVSVFISKVIDPENPFGSADCVRILLLQFSCLLVEQASPHIHDASNKRQGNKLRRLMTFAWPCLLGKNCVDPATRYHGHLLLSHIIAKFAIHKRIVLQVFHSLLKAHTTEAHNVVCQAFKILMPSMPVRMEDGITMLTHWTEKIIVEEGHSMPQLFHILQLVVQHFKVYYPVRHHLVQHMVGSIQRLGLSPSTTINHRKLAVDLADVIIKWELERIKDETETSEYVHVDGSRLKRSLAENGPSTTAEPLRKHIKTMLTGLAGPSSIVATVIPKHEPKSAKAIEKIHADTVLNCLLRLACLMNDATTGTSSTITSPGEQLSRYCVTLLKTALKPEMWSDTCDIKLVWLEKVLFGVESQAPNYGNICTALEILTFLLGVLRKDQLLVALSPLQKGIALCATSSNSRVIRLVHTLLTRLMAIFPTETASVPCSSKYKELEILYTSLGKLMFEGLATYEKNTSISASSLLSTLMMLKAACINNASYIDRMITPIVRILQRMTREHLNPSSQDSNPVCSEMLILCLNLVKSRVVVMGAEMRKAFIGTILVGLIEKSTDSKILKAITKMIEDWMKAKGSVAINQSPTLREKSILLEKLMYTIERKFTDDSNLCAQFLDIVNFIYRDEVLRNSELIPKLEPAFLAGLRCSQPLIRAKFFEIFDASLKRRLHDRMMYICCSQNWEAIGSNYWIKQCIELVLTTACPETPLYLSDNALLLPNTQLLTAKADLKDRELHFAQLNKEEREEIIEFLDCLDREDDSDIDVDRRDSQDDALCRMELTKVTERQGKMLDALRGIQCSQLLGPIAQLCHLDNNLTEIVWLDLFPRLWGLFSDKQQKALIVEFLPFVSSGIHLAQRDCTPSALGTFVEGISRCRPPIIVTPPVMNYLGKTHNIWHRMALCLEEQAFEHGNNSQLKNKREIGDCSDFEPVASPQQEILDTLARMYAMLCEDDMFAGLLMKHAQYKETNIALAFEQQGFYEQAQGYIENVQSKARSEFSNSPAPSSHFLEFSIWKDHWAKCCRELNQWDSVLEFSKSKNKNVYNPYHILDSAWRIPNWHLMKEALGEVQENCPNDYQWKMNLYRGFLAICQPEEQNLSIIDKYVELASTLCMREWKRLPVVISQMHLPYLQAAQLIVELQEAAQIHQGWIDGRTNSLHDMKAIVKTWQNRLPVIADDLSHWSDIFTWRQHHYSFITSHYDAQQDQLINHSTLGVHASLQAIIHFGKIARKQNLSGVCLNSLSRIYTIPSVPIVDCFQKIIQQVKCYMQMATVEGNTKFQDGLEVIESTYLKYFTKKMIAEFLAYKGMLLSQLGCAEEAYKAFSAACKLHDMLTKAWALWGDFLEALFTRDPKNMEKGQHAIICFMHACRHQNEPKSRKYLAKSLWLLIYEDEKCTLTEAIDKYSVGVPQSQWLPWIPQLLTSLVRNEGKVILNLISQVGRMFPQAVYFPIRTLYLTLKIEQRECYKSVEMAAMASESSTSPAPSTTGEPIRATPPMWRCLYIIQMQRNVHPTILSSLEGIVDQMVSFRESWYEEVSLQLRQGLAKCLAIAFENRGAVVDATITPHILNFIKKLVSFFENISNSVSTTFSSAASESLASLVRATVQDPVFQRMKVQFTTDFDFTTPGSKRLQNLIAKLRKWITILEEIVKTFPKSFLIEEKCRFLSNFSLHTAEIELPGEFLLPKHTHYYIRISRFMPRVDIVNKHNRAARRLFVRGHNGKVYHYLVVNDSGFGDARREERVLQLLRMLNHFLGKQKETARRFLHYTVPKVVAVSPQMRLVEDKPASISLLDIYKQSCAKKSQEPDMPLMRYYDRLAAVQARGSQATHQILKNILKDIQSNVVTRTLLRDWACKTFTGATDYWTFRKVFTLQLALFCLAEYVLHLTQLNPDMMYLHQDSGLMNISYFKFDLDETRGELDANRPVPFRLTPNIAEFVSIIGMCGPLTASMIATARCLVTPNFNVEPILKAILRDEMIASHKKKQDDSLQSLSTNPPKIEQGLLINMVTKGVNAIMARLSSLSNFNGTDSKVGTLVTAANSHDNLCRMDPAWHPWL